MSGQRQKPPDDVRMRGFAHRSTVAAALEWLDSVTQSLQTTHVPLMEAAGRVLAEDIRATVDVPGFDRAMMDGYAVRATDVLGASLYNRLPLMVVGQVLPGRPPSQTVLAGQAVRIMTGAPLPEGADAVLPAEQAEVQGDQLYAQDEIPPGKHVGQRGEDIAAGSIVLPRLRRLRPQDLGILSSIGVAQVPVVTRPRVQILVTGDELLVSGSEPVGYQIPDANTPMLEALVLRDGGLPSHCGIIPDQPERLWQAMSQCAAEVLLVSGGSSVGQEDHAPNLVRQHGELVVHGIAMRPSSPAGLGRLGQQLVVLLPGNPVSCLCAYDFFAGRAIRALGGRSRNWPYLSKRLVLRRKLVSTVGRVDYARVKIVEEQVEPLATSGASILSSTTRADGFIIIPSDSEGYPPGCEVQVYLYD